MKILNSEIRLKKIKVNVLSTGFWVAPSDVKLFSPKNYSYSVKKANSLEDVIKYNNLTSDNYYFSFNEDHDYNLFNKLLRINNFNFQITKKVEEKIKNEGYYDISLNEKVSLRFDIKSLYNIYKGFSFFVNLNYFDTLIDYYLQKKIQKEKYIFLWRKKEFLLVN